MVSPLTARLVRCVCSTKEILASPDSLFCSVRCVDSTTCQESFVGKLAW